jgi:iron complex transport system ATP-binding protein
MTLLSVNDLRASLGGAEVLKGVSFDVRPGEFIGLIGPNGAGKSTLLRAILQLSRHGGTVRLGGDDAARLSVAKRAARVAYLAQERDVAWAVPVDTLVSLGRTRHRSPFAPLSPEDRAAVDDAMRRMDVAQFRRRKVTELSGGELARVLIARALAQDTPLLLADEPVAGLDPAHQISLMRVFRSLAEEGRSVVASLHDLGLAARWCSRLLLLDAGRIVANGPAAEVLTGERLRSVYGISAHIADIEGHLLVHPLDLAEPIAKGNADD